MTACNFTCITCSVAFKDADVQRDHYKTDWHRYNLKRKVAELGPVTLEDFKSRVAKHEEQMKSLSGETKPPTGYCVCCSKQFATQKAFENHIKSKKHLQAEKNFNLREDKLEIQNNRLNRKPVEDEVDDDDDMEVEEVDSDEWDEDEELEGDPIPVTDCLFCEHHSATMDKNVIHMGDRHSFFIPDIEFLIDMEGLLKYLGAKVGQGRMCLWCNERKSSFQSVLAVRQHMQDKGHSKMLHEGEALLEYSDYYDYTTSYPKGQNGDEEVELNQLDDDSYELVLPSGAKVGHRSLAKYFKQSLVPDRAVVVRGSKTSGDVMNHYRNFGWTGLSISEVRKRAKDVQFMKRLQQKDWMKIGTKANRLQTHFRDPNGMC